MDPSADLPVVISHFNGRPRYLTHALRSAARWNRRVVLLGDASNAVAWPDHEDCARYQSPRYAEFLRVYEKMSFYADAYETAFWRRMFDLEHWMATAGQAQAVLLDSDVVTFADYRSTMPKVIGDAHDVALMCPATQDRFLWAYSCHVSYWTLSALREFLTFCIAGYRAGPVREALEAKWRWHQEQHLPGGVCEMTLLYLWAVNRPGVRDLSQEIDGEVFDHQFGSPMNHWDIEYAMRHGRKDVRFQSGRPTGFNLRSQRAVRFQCLHCQGDAKQFMGWLSHPVGRQLWPIERGVSRVVSAIKLPIRLSRRALARAGRGSAA